MKTRKEPIGEGWRLLEPGVDTWQEGDEFFTTGAWGWISIDSGYYSKPVELTDNPGRRRIKNPWNRVPKHSDYMKVGDYGANYDKLAIAGGGNVEPTTCRVGFEGPMRTHYLLVSDLPDLPEEKPVDEFETWWSQQDITQHSFKGFVKKAWGAAKKA